MNINRYTGFLCGLMLLLAGLTTAASAASQIVIVKSSDNAYFNQSIETLINHVDPLTRFKTVMAEDLTRELEDNENNSFFVTLGQAAAQAVNRLDSGRSSFGAYLTHEQYKDLQLENQSTVLLDQPLHRYLVFCKLMLAAGSIGLIDDREIRLDRSQSELLERLDFELNQYRIDQANKLLPVLRRLLRQNDALLMLPRQSIYNRDTLKGVLLTSYRIRKPAISYSPAHVKSGALASIYSSPVDIGRHLAQLINRKLQYPAHETPAYQFAKFYSIATNRRIAKALGIELPAESELRSAIDRLEP
ncbi:MAG: hypothetical protein JSU67_06525 [Gammaproteobacteria bacterium]|nr:MAG: hypothetical protein JSU67_06525 [Gammaproteobacteria bacterium]